MPDKKNISFGLDDLFIEEREVKTNPYGIVNTYPKFDPEGSGYDFETAFRYKIEPDETGHYPSRAPETGQILKGKNHPTFDKTIKGEDEAGYEIKKSDNGRYYSQPSQITQIKEASKNQNFVNPNIQSSDKIQVDDRTITDAPRSRDLDPVTSKTLQYLLSPLNASVQGMRAAGDTMEESKQAFKEGDIGGGLLGTGASLIRAGFSAATPVIPALTAFTAGTEIASDVVGEDVVSSITQPITSLTKPESLAGRSGAEIGDLIAQILIAKGGHSAVKGVKNKVNKLNDFDLPEVFKSVEANIEPKFRVKENQTVPLKGVTQEKLPVDLTEKVTAKIPEVKAKEEIAPEIPKPETDTTLPIKEKIYNLLQFNKGDPASRKKRMIKDARVQAQNLRGKGINAEVRRNDNGKGYGFYIDGVKQGKRELGLIEKREQFKPEDVEITKPEAQKRFEELPQEVRDRQEIIAENFVDVADLPQGIGESKLKKGVQDIKEDNGKELSPEAKIVREAAENIIESGKEIRPVKGSTVKENISSDDIKGFVDEKIEQKAIREESGDTSFKFGENKNPSKVLSGEIPTPEVANQAKKILGDKFNGRLQAYLAEPNNKARISGAKNKILEEGLITEDFVRKTVAADLLGEKNINADLVGIARQAKTRKPEQLGFEGMNKPTFKKGEEYLKPKGKGEETTPLFQQEKTVKGQDELFATFGSRKGLQPTEVIKKSEFKDSDLNDVTRLNQIGKTLVRDIELTAGKDVRTGSRILKRFGKMEGFYSPKNGLVRLRNINDVGVLAHELGHKLDIELFKSSENLKFNDRVDRVIARLSGLKNTGRKEKVLNSLRKKYGNDVVDSVLERRELRKELESFLKGIGHYKIDMREGVAEFISRYVVEPSTARKLAPKFNNLFENLLDQNPMVRSALQNARTQVKEFQSQDPRQITESTIARDVETDSFIDKIRKGAKSFYFNVVDGTKPFRDLERAMLEKNPQLKGVDNPLHQVLSLIGVDGKAKQFLENHPFRKSGNDIEILKDKKPFMEIFSTMLKDGNLKSHEGYLTSLRNLELYENKKGAAATTTLEIAKQTKELYEKQLGKDYLEQLSQDLREYNNSLLDYYKDSGKIDASTLTSIKEMNQYYVPFKRFFEEFEATGQMPNVSKYVKDSSPSPVKQIRGSQREIVSPIGSIIKNTYDMIAAADRNTSLKTLINSLESIDKSLVQEIPARVTRRRTVIGEEGLEKKFTVEYEKPQGENIITVWNSGKPKYYQIPKDYYDSFFAINEQVSKAIRIFSVPSRILQAGAVVYDPTFAVRNVPRDQISAAFYSKYGYNPIDFVKGLFGAIKKDDLYQKFLASGSDQSFLTAMDQMLSKKYMEEKVGKRIETSFQKYRRNPLLALQDLNRATELGTRVGAFKKAYEKSGDVYKAMQEGREIAADYGVKGKSMSNISPLYPFLNARMQHAKLTLKAIKDNPGKTTAKGLMFVSAPTLINWLANNVDERRKLIYSELPEWRKAGFFNVPIPGTDSFLPIPKGFFGQIFGTSIEMTLDWINENDNLAIKDLASQMFDDLSPMSNPVDIIPQVGRPIVEQFANKKGFTGQPIVSERLKNLEPSQQFYESTPEIIKAFGGLIGLSPARIEAFITAYTAGAGRGAIYITDEILQTTGIVDKKPDDAFSVLSKMPIFRALVTETPIGTRGKSVQSFYEKLDELEEINSQVNSYISAENSDRLQEYISGKEDDYKFYLKNQKQINKFKDVLRTVRELKYEIFKDNTIKNKREKVKEIELQVTSVAKEFENAYSKNESFNLNKYLTAILNQEKLKNKYTRKEQKYFKQRMISEN